MPELPEVEMVRQVLEPQLCGRCLAGLILNRPEVIAQPGPEIFTQRVAGRRVNELGRRGKYLLVRLDSGDTLMVHLRMTGRLLVVPSACPEEKHTHIVFRLDGGEDLRFIDTRRFGRLWLIPAGGEDEVDGIVRLGPEPFDVSFDASYLRTKCGSSRRGIKTCLLDQRVVAGIGNIYADEILFAAGIAPNRPAADLSETEWQRLAQAVPAVLSAAIVKNRMTPEQYLAGGGREYRSDRSLNVYGREGAACPVCGAPVIRRTLAGRSSYSCPRCQKL